VDTIYAPKQYYERIKTFLSEYRPGNRRRLTISPVELIGLIRSTWALGVKERGQIYYWRLVAWTLLKKPKTFPLSVAFAAEGLHFRKVAQNVRISLAGDTRRLEQISEPLGK
jgi:hypothetical protein